MMNKTTRNQILLLLTALIWGVAFVAQETGGALSGPATFNCLRSFVAIIVLIPAIKFLDKIGATERVPKTREDYFLLVKAGVISGTFLSAGSLAQQYGLWLGATAGKAGFLTACYIIIVPLLGFFVGRRPRINVLIAAFVALTGLCFLCLKEANLTFETADIVVLSCAFLYSLQIMAVDKYAPLVEGVRMSLVQFVVAVIFSAVPMILFESGTSMESIERWAMPLFSSEFVFPLLYAAVLSSGVAYTLQIIGQQGVNPALASLLMSMESVFAVLAGWFFLGEVLSMREIFGCALMFIAILLAQLPTRRF